MSRRRVFQSFSARALAVTLTGAVTYQIYTTNALVEYGPIPPLPHRYSRVGALSTLQASEAAPYDIVVIGGGVIGLGVAVDAVTRGLRVALVEQDDWGSGASSGTSRVQLSGAQELELAVKQRDVAFLPRMVSYLRDRASLRRNGPHLVATTSMVSVHFDLFDVARMVGFMTLFTVLSGPWAVGGVWPVSANGIRAQVPCAVGEAEINQIIGGVQYQEMVVNDVRLCISLAMTAACHGATVVNYVKANKAVQQPDGVELHLADVISGKQFLVRSKVLVNCAGASCDQFLKTLPQHTSLYEPAGADDAVPMVCLPASLCPSGCGLLVPRAVDGSNLALIPTPEGQGAILSGTVSLSELYRVLAYIVPGTTERNLPPQSRWYQTRGRMVPDPRQVAASRNGWALMKHNDAVYSVLGGTLSLYRSVAADAVDTILRSVPSIAQGKGEFVPFSRSRRVILVGGEQPPLSTAELVSVYPFLDGATAQRLCATYGCAVHDVLAHGGSERIGGGLLRGDVVQAVQEGALHAVDVLRRTQLLFTNDAQCVAALPGIVRVMDQLRNGFNSKEELRSATEYLLRKAKAC